MVQPQDTLAEDTGQFPASIETRKGTTDELSALMTRFRQVAPDMADDELEGDGEPFFWTARISNTELDDHSTHMLPSSLKNYAADAEAGVPFMNSHRTGGGFLLPKPTELPMGRSLSGTYHAGQRTGAPHTEATFYTMRGMKLGEVSTDDFIRGVRSGVVKSVSIGFRGGQFICDVCGEDMLRSEACEHFPGMEYEKTEGKKKIRLRATAGIENARLAETSAVFSGSTPGAIILKASRMSEAGKFTRAQQVLISDRYRMLLPGMPTWFAAGANGTSTGTVRNTPQEETAMTVTGTEERTDQSAALQQQLDAIRSAFQANATADLVALCERNATLLTEQAAEIERLKPMAADGETYRASLIAEALHQGKRAFGENFSEERYKGILERADVEAVKGMRDNFKEAADRALPNGRQTTDTDGKREDAEEETPPRRRPAGRRGHSV